MGVIAIVLVTILSVMPFIGSLIAESPGIQAFLEGLIIFRILSGHTVSQMLTEANVQGNIYPGFWASVGFLIIAGILVRLTIFGLTLLCAPLENTIVGELIQTFITPVLGVLGGIIPLFMYSSYVCLSIMHLTRAVQFLPTPLR